MVGFCLEAESLESAINVRTSSSTNLHLNQGILLIPHREQAKEMEEGIEKHGAMAR